MTLLLLAMPLLVRGLAVGFRLEPRVDLALLRRQVLLLLVLVGLRLIALDVLG